MYSLLGISPFLEVILMIGYFLIPIFGAVFLAIAQWLVYRALHRFGVIEEMPFFFVFLFRGLIATIAISVILAMLFQYSDLGVRPPSAP